MKGYNSIKFKITLWALASSFFVGTLFFMGCSKDRSSVIDYSRPVLIGKWTNDVLTNRKPTFTKDSVWWDDAWSYGYKVSNDTFYALAYRNDPYPDPEFTFSFADKNETLIIRTMVPGDVIVYKRVKTPL